jgi:hypothetical protein
MNFFLAAFQVLLWMSLEESDAMPSGWRNAVGA